MGNCFNISTIENPNKNIIISSNKELIIEREGLNKAQSNNNNNNNKESGEIELEVIPAKNKYGKFINIKKEEESFYHIYFNDNKEEEIKRNFLNENENKIKRLHKRIFKN